MLGWGGERERGDGGRERAYEWSEKDLITYCLVFSSHLSWSSQKFINNNDNNDDNNNNNNDNDDTVSLLKDGSSIGKQNDK